MSDHTIQPHPDSSAMPGKHMRLKQSGWMGHWMQGKYKRPHDDNLCLQEEDSREMKQRSLSCGQVSQPSGSKSLDGVSEVANNRSMEVVNRFTTDGTLLLKEKTNLLSFPIFSALKNGGVSSKQVPGAQTGQHNEFHAAANATIEPHSSHVSGRQLQQTESVTIDCKLPNLELELRSHDSVEVGCGRTLKSFRGKLPNLPSGYPYEIMCREEKAIPYESTSKEHLTYHSYQAFNVETMRVSSTLDTLPHIHVGPPLYTETTKHFFITEKTAIGVSDEAKIFRESMLSAKFNGNLGGLLSLSPVSGQVRPGLKLRLIDDPTDSEQKDRGSEETQKDERNQCIGRLDTVAGVMDETSAETHTMEADTYMENNHNRGPVVSRLNKDMSPSQITMSSQGKSQNIELPDMNEVAPHPDEGEPSTSRTQSLDMECLISCGDNPCNSKSVPDCVFQTRPELGSHWVKRLKLSGSSKKYVGLGIKSSTIEEAPSHEKLCNLSNNLLNRSVDLTSSEPTMGAHTRHTSECKKIAEVPHLSNGKKASTESLTEDRKHLLSHPWIRRWSRYQATSPEKQPMLTESSETQMTSLDHFQKKTFPSTAAMALMGKAMNGFRPCEFTKKGSFIVWNTNNQPDY